MITGAQLVKDFPAVGERRLEVVNALLREHSLYPVDVSPLLFDQNASFAMLALAVVFLRGRQCHRAPNSRISTFIGDEPTHQRQDIDPIGFCAARSSIDLKAGWVPLCGPPDRARESVERAKNRRNRSRSSR
jgi:hypothetical protein